MSGRPIKRTLRGHEKRFRVRFSVADGQSGSARPAFARHGTIVPVVAVAKTLTARNRTVLCGQCGQGARSCC